MTWKLWVKENWGFPVAWVCMLVFIFWGVSTAMSRLVPQTHDPKTVEYIGDTPEGWKVYRVQGADRPSGYVAIPPGGK